MNEKEEKCENYKKMLNKFRRKTFSLDGRGNQMSLATGHSLTKKKIITKKIYYTPQCPAKNYILPQGLLLLLPWFYL